MKRIPVLAIALLLLSACGKGANEKIAAPPAAPASTPSAAAQSPTPAPPQAPPAPLAASDAIDYTTVAAARVALSKRTDVQSREDDGWLIVADPGAGAFWSFTPPDHAANPAVVKRTIHEKDGVISVAMATLCEGPKPACAELTHQFEDINERMRADIQHQADARKR